LEESMTAFGGMKKSARIPPSTAAVASIFIWGICRFFRGHGDGLPLRQRRQRKYMRHVDALAAGFDLAERAAAGRGLGLSGSAGHATAAGWN
jgi:hypothetical protein